MYLSTLFSFGIDNDAEHTIAEINEEFIKRLALFQMTYLLLL